MVVVTTKRCSDSLFIYKEKRSNNMFDIKYIKFSGEVLTDEVRRLAKRIHLNVILLISMEQMKLIQ